MPIYPGVIGLAFRASFLTADGEPYDLRDAISVTLLFRGPKSVEEFVKTPTIADDGTYAEYLTVEGDIDRDGKWKVQGLATDAEGRWPTDVHTFQVDPNI